MHLYCADKEFMMETETWRLVDEKEAAARLTLPVQTLRNWRFRGKGPRYVKLGRCVRYREAELNRFVNEHTQVGRVDS